MDEFRIHGKLVMDAEVSNQPLALPAPEGFQSADNFQSFAEAQINSTDSLKDNTAIMKEFGNIMPEIIKNLRAMNDIVNRTNQNLPAVRRNENFSDQEKRRQRQDELTRQGLLGFFNNGNYAVQAIASGNVSGAAIGGINSITNTANNLSSMAKNAEMTDLAKGLMAAGVVTAIVGTVVKGTDTLANKFIESMPTVYGSGRAFGSMNDYGALSAYHTLNTYNKATGLDIDTFQGIAQSLRKQGVANGLEGEAQLAQVGNIARTTSRWAYATGGDASQFANLAGLMSRYGGSSDVEKDFNYIMSAGRASGLNDTQLPEFLSGIQKVMEDGISKGFSRSATDVANTMLMFSKMSGGNAFWQGEQGAKLLNQANNGLSSATGLSKTSDIIAYRAIARAYEGKQESALGKDLYLADGGYVNNMMLLEQGLNANNFGSIMSAIGETSPNTEGKIERLRQMFGVNYTGASRLLKLYQDNGGKVSDTQIEKITKAPEYQNKETQYQDAVNSIKDAVVRIGSKAADLKIEGMELVSKGVTALANHFVNTGNGINDVVSDNPTKEEKWEKNIDDDALRGYSAAGAWAVNEIKHTETDAINAYLSNGEYGSYIKGLAGEDTDDFMKVLLFSKNKNADWVRRQVEEETIGDTPGVSYKEERDTTKELLQKLYDLFAKGEITIRDVK